jgi:hypothetical protein
VLRAVGFGLLVLNFCFMVQGSGFRGYGFGIWGLGFRVLGF